MMFAWKIENGVDSSTLRAPWVGVIKTEKTAIPRWNVDSPLIWKGLRTFNLARGNEAVPTRYLMGFMRKWRAFVAALAWPSTQPIPEATDAELAALIRNAPMKNWRFHERDLQRMIGLEAHDDRVQVMRARLGVICFAEALAGHGRAVQGEEIRA